MAQILSIKINEIRNSMEVEQLMIQIFFYLQKKIEQKQITGFLQDRALD